MSTPVLQPHHPPQIGPYPVLGVLGAGGTGEVLLAAGANGLVAVKVVHPGLASDAQFRVRFAREVEAGRRVRGPWAAAVVDADPQAQLPWLATTYVPGIPLAHAVSATGPLPPPAVAALAAHLARALVDIHATGLVHGDVEPANVLLGPAHAVLTDIGISRARDDTRVAGTGLVVGTPAFLPPEQAEGNEPTTASDVFSFGAVLVWAATGQGPFGDGPPVTLLRRIRTAEPELGALTEPVRGLVARCLHRDSAARPTAAQLVAQLDARLGPVPGGPGWLPAAVGALLPDPTRFPRPAGAPPTGRRFPLRVSRRGLLLGLGAVAVAGAGIGIVGLLTAEEPEPEPEVRWTYPTEGPVVGITADAGGTVFAVTEASESGTLHAIDVGTGQARWTYPLYGPVSGAVTVDGLVVVQGGGVHALDPGTGDLRWDADLAQLLAAGETITVCSTSSMDGRDMITAVDTATGTARWNVPVGEAYDGSSHGLGLYTPAAVAAGRVFVALAESLRTFDAVTGALLWEQPLPAATQSLAVDGEIVCCTLGLGTGLSDTLVAFDAGTGREAWSRTAGDSEGNYGPLTAQNGTLYFMRGARVVAWDAATGTPRWERPLPSPHSAMNTAPVVHGDTLYVGGVAYRGSGADSRGSLLRYNTSSGEHQLPIDPDPNPGSKASFTIAGGRLVVGTADLQVESGAVMGIW